MRNKWAERERQEAAPRDASAPDAPEQSMNDRLLELQRSAGNNSVKAFVQTKLEVGSADDAYEREADEIASTVVGHNGAPSGGHGGGDAGDGFTASPQLASFVSRGGGAPLSSAVRRNLEPRFGLDFKDVRVHDDNKTAAMAESIGARAFTYGNDVYFGKGSYRPGSRDGDHLLAHELTHVAQQTGAAPRKVARSFDGSKVPTRLAARRIQGNFFKKAKQAKSKFKELTGKSKKETTFTTGDKHLDQKSQPELREYMSQTKGGGPAENPDWSNPKFFGEEPTSYKVKLGVAQDDANWLKNMKAFRNVGYKAVFSSEGREDLKQAVGAKTKEAKKAAKEVFVKKTLQGQGALDGLTDEQVKQKITDFTEGINSVGHTWVRLEAYVGGELKDIYSYGMYPAKATSVIDRETQLGGFGGMASAGPGEIVHPDTAHEGDAMTAYYGKETKKKNFDKALALAGERYQAPPPYVLLGYNCTAFAREIFQAAGATYPSKGTLLPGFAYTPGNLYQAISKKLESEEKTKKPSGKYSKTDDQKDIVDKVKGKQEVIAEKAHSDTQAEALAVPPEGAESRWVKFHARRKFKYGLRPNAALDHEFTLDKTRTMIQVGNGVAQAKWGVETYMMGPKTYWFIKVEESAEAQKPWKLPEPPARTKVKGPPKLKVYAGGQNEPPGNDAESDVLIDVTKLGSWIERKRVGDWVRIFNTDDQEAFWARSSAWSHYYKPPEDREVEGDEEKGGDVEPQAVPIFAWTESYITPKRGATPVGDVMGDELEDCKVNDRDEGWVDLLDRKSKKRFWVREDAYKYALDPKRNPKPAPLPEPEVESKDDENDLDPSDDETDLTTLLDESPETSDESAVSADQLPVYYAAFDQNPPRMLTTQQIMDGDPFWSNDVPGWKTLSINYTEGYSIKESDYERWMVLTGQKAPEEVKDDDTPETTSEFEVTAEEFPVFLNKGDATPLRMMTASEMKAAFNVDWIGVDGGEDWIFLEINMSDNYAVRRTDYDKWLELSGG